MPAPSMTVACPSAGISMGAVAIRSIRLFLTSTLPRCVPEFFPSKISTSFISIIESIIYKLRSFGMSNMRPDMENARRNRPECSLPRRVPPPVSRGLSNTIIRPNRFPTRRPVPASGTNGCSARRRKPYGFPAPFIPVGIFSPFFGFNQKKYNFAGTRKQETIHFQNKLDYMKRDNKVFDLIEQEKQRQLHGIELIASENFVSDEVMQAMGSVLTNKYAEGYPGARYYGGCQVVDKVEQLAIDRVCELYGAEYANVQPHSGAQANMAVFMAVLKPGDTFM